LRGKDAERSTGGIEEDAMELEEMVLSSSKRDLEDDMVFMSWEFGCCVLLLLVGREI
jgi:hypothetical protein